MTSENGQSNSASTISNINPRTSSKAKVLVDFVIELVHKETDIKSKTDKWKLHVDGASSKQGSGIGIQLESPIGEMI